jgi:hypothetical protein
MCSMSYFSWKICFLLVYKNNKLIFDFENYLVVHDQNLNMAVAKFVKDVKNGLNTNLKLILSKTLQNLWNHL